MKRFNVSILAVVAVLAIGLTAFTKAEPVAKRAVISHCYSQLNPAYDPTTCAINSFVLNQQEVCDADVTSQVNKGLLGLTTSSYTASLNCGELNQVFCCAQLIVDPSPCPSATPAQPAFTFIDKDGVLRTGQRAQIFAVFCKPS
ncbi:hypothetical protein [Chitinophaga rhizosphaerae]|uniref:hypothetical protein n=1 Tax=Chitinophaga rhizosphaerae TaxID=1864947 RepID=UPI000F808D5C|nr:hypothetical protein [Chitinophaga rhizosphaerae]